MGIHNIEELFNLPPAKKKRSAAKKQSENQQELDLAPDADEKGDPLPNEFKDLIHKGDIVPDNVDKQEVER